MLTQAGAGLGAGEAAAHHSVVLHVARVEVGRWRDLCSSVSFVVDIVTGGDEIPVQTSTASHGDLAWSSTYGTRVLFRSEIYFLVIVRPMKGSN